MDNSFWIKLTHPDSGLKYLVFKWICISAARFSDIHCHVFLCLYHQKLKMKTCSCPISFFILPIIFRNWKSICVTMERVDSRFLFNCQNSEKIRIKKKLIGVVRRRQEFYYLCTLRGTQWPERYHMCSYWLNY